MRTTSRTMPRAKTTSTLAFTSLLVILCVCTCHTPVVGQTNNTVDEASNKIIWGELAPDKPYKTADYKADDGGLDPYYALATSFIDSSLPELLPVEKVKGILDGDKTIQDEWQDLAKDFVGFALCIVIGFLFIFIFPIVACCFCCCRCCGNCGGKRIQKPEDNSKCKRTVFSVVLAILSLFVITGAACTFVTSDQLSKNLDGLNSSFSDSIDDFNTYLDNIDSQFTRIGDTNFNFMKDVLVVYVANASSELSERITTAINKVVGMQTVLGELSTLSGTALDKVGELESKVNQLETQKDQAVIQLTTLSNQCNQCLGVEIGALNGTDLQPMKDNIADFKMKVSTDVFGKMRDDIDDAIRTEVEDGTKNFKVGDEMNKIYEEQLKGLLDKVDDLKSSLNKDAATYQDTVGDFTDTAGPYDKYRWYAGLGLAVFLVLIGLLMLLGVALGFCCGSAATRPTERGGASNCGGICLMSAVGLIFIFGALLMLLTTLMYLFGAMTERYVCQSIDNLDRVEKYTSSFNLGYDLSNISFEVQGEVVVTSASKLMSSCKEGKTLYNTLNLAGVVDTALQKITDYKNQINLTGTINANDAAKQLNANTLDVDAQITALNESVNAITDVKTTITTLKGNLETQKTTADGKKPGAGDIFDPMLATLGEMETITGDLQTTAIAIKGSASELPQYIQNATDKLKDNTVMAGVITNTTQAFVDTIFGFVDSYTNDIKTKLQTDVGKCTPIYSITNAILSEAFCHGIVDPLNGFWLALGWCLFFFMPSLIIAVKLAKYYRTMLYEEEFDSTLEPSAKPPPYYTEPSAPPANHFMPNNKVAPF
ncbi:prominin-1-like [Littorina saxatilis]|uniref:prominin-1-like n=1 Tax=Littorina saxatilis TaxID=31220 RepID=UPI0038B4B8CB